MTYNDDVFVSWNFSHILVAFNNLFQSYTKINFSTHFFLNGPFDLCLMQYNKMRLQLLIRTRNDDCERRKKLNDALRNYSSEKIIME